tara:strand:- start:255 stop:500 length:246 start_codon:yes stop_codon:yes gene_type:complete
VGRLPLNKKDNTMTAAIYNNKLTYKEMKRIKDKYFETAKAKNIHLSKEELIKIIAELEYESDSTHCHDHGFDWLNYIDEPY